MKTGLICFLIIILGACRSSDNSANKAALRQRLDQFIHYYQQADAENMLNYVYPRVFTLVNREQALVNSKNIFSSAENTVSLDSINLSKIYPIFAMDSSEYCKIELIFVVSFFIDAAKEGVPSQSNAVKKPGIVHEIGSAYPAPQRTLMATLLKSQFGAENVSVNDSAGTIKLRAHNNLIAVKDGHLEQWSFVQPGEKDTLLNKLFSKKVLDKFAGYR